MEAEHAVYREAGRQGIEVPGMNVVGMLVRTEKVPFQMSDVSDDEQPPEGAAQPKVERE